MIITIAMFLIMLTSVVLMYLTLRERRGIFALGALLILGGFVLGGLGLGITRLDDEWIIRVVVLAGFVLIMFAFRSWMEPFE